jgi:hypothetical protein
MTSRRSTIVLSVAPQSFLNLANQAGVFVR